MALRLLAANSRDTDFIFGLILHGARKGHFLRELADDRARLRTVLNGIINTGFEPVSGLASQAMVGWLGPARVGAAIVVATEEADRGVELGVIAVRQSQQGQGHGAAMLDALLAFWLPRRSMYARCFPDSETLYRMLLHRGFNQIGTRGQQTRVLYHGATQGIAPPLGTPLPRPSLNP